MNDHDADHDHSGDRLGEREPVESLTVDSVSIREFAQPSSYVVFTDGESWYGLRTATQDVEFASADGVEVINAALARLGELSDDGRSKGTVRVTSRAGPSETVLESGTTIEHTTDGTSLILERGTHFEYTGTDQAVVLAGDSLRFEYEGIRASDAPYVVRDLGLSNSYVHGHVLFGGSDSVWFSDAANQLHTPPPGSRSHLLLTWMRPTDEALHGIKMTSEPGSRLTGYRWITPVMFGTNGAGVVLGDRSDADTVNHNVFYGDVDPSQGPGTSLLVDVNDSHNAVYLKDWIRTSGGSFDGRGTDVRIGHAAEDSFIIPLTYARVRVQREALRATDMSRVDSFKSATIRTFDIFPDTLAGYDVDQRESGHVHLHSGHVEHTTGMEPGSLAGLQKRHDVDYGRLTFDNRAILQTNVQVADNAGQKAWLVWGDRDGPAVGWRIVDDVLEGYVHDGDEASTVPLRTGFEPRSSWNLTALSHPTREDQPDQVLFYVEDAATRATAAPSDDAAVEVEEDPGFGGIHWKVKGVAAEATVATIGTDESEKGASTSIPSGVGDAHKIMTIELINTEPEAKALRWSNWRHSQRFPIFHR